MMFFEAQQHLNVSTEASLMLSRLLWKMTVLFVFQTDMPCRLKQCHSTLVNHPPSIGISVSANLDDDNAQAFCAKPK